MNVAFYIFDAKKNELRFEVAKMDEVKLLLQRCNRRPGNIYISNSKGNHYCVSTKEEKIIFDHLWLYQRDDEKARALFKGYYEKKKKELNNQVVKLWRRIDLLDGIHVIANGV